MINLLHILNHNSNNLKFLISILDALYTAVYFLNQVLNISRRP